jgi:hypothetical protein
MQANVPSTSHHASPTFSSLSSHSSHIHILCPTSLSYPDKHNPANKIVSSLITIGACTIIKCCTGTSLRHSRDRDPSLPPNLHILPCTLYLAMLVLCDACARRLSPQNLLCTTIPERWSTTAMCKPETRQNIKYHKYMYLTLSPSSPINTPPPHQRTHTTTPPRSLFSRQTHPRPARPSSDHPKADPPYEPLPHTRRTPIILLT